MSYKQHYNPKKIKKIYLILDIQHFITLYICFDDVLFYFNGKNNLLVQKKIIIKRTKKERLCLTHLDVYLDLDK